MRSFSLALWSATLIGGVMLLFYAAHLPPALAGAEIPFDAGKVGLVGPDQNPDRDVIAPEGGRSEGTRVIASAIEVIVRVIRMILGSIALVWIIFSAAKLVAAGHQEKQVSEAKNGITWAVIGLLLMFLVDTAILEVLYGGSNFAAGEVTENPDNMNTAVDNALEETLGLLEWVKGIIIMIAVGYLIFSGMRVIASLGESDAISAQKNLIKWIGIGIVVLLLNEVIVTEVLYPRMLGENYQVDYEPDASRGIREAVGILRYFLQFMALVALLAVLYGGALWALSFGEEDRIQRGKKVLKGAAIGIVIVLMSLVITSTLVSVQLSGGAT